MKCMVQEAKSPEKNPIKKRCAEGFNSGVKGLNTVQANIFQYKMLSYDTPEDGGFMVLRYTVNLL
jgi:hypothetical protein